MQQIYEVTLILATLSGCLQIFCDLIWITLKIFLKNLNCKLLLTIGKETTYFVEVKILCKCWKYNF